MAANFIPPIPIGQFRPSSEAIASWLYEVWKYLQENPIPSEGDITGDAETVAENYVAENVPPMIASAIAALSYAHFVDGSTLPIYRAANDEISNQDLIEAWDEGCRFALVDDENVYVMIRNGNIVNLLQILTEQQAEGVVSVNGQTGVVTLAIPDDTDEIANRSNVSGATATAALNSIKTQIDNMLLSVYPVGSYYWSNDNTSPATKFGGTWAQITNDGSIVIEQGTSNIWTYRKFSDGVAECWGETYYNVTDWTAFGGLYEANPGHYINYPENLFIAAPVLNVTPGIYDGGLVAIEMYSGATASRTPTMYGLRPDASSNVTRVIMQMHAIGAWRNTKTPIYLWVRTA